MDESQSIILLEFDYRWSISYSLRLKTAIVDPDLRKVCAGSFKAVWHIQKLKT